jgi:DNA-binding XRE family transcriptional regulator
MVTPLFRHAGRNRVKIAGDEIRDARERAHLTQQELGRLVGVSLRTIGNWERGESVPKSRMGALVEVLNLTPEPQPDQPLPKGGLQYLIQDNKGDLSLPQLANRCNLNPLSGGRTLHKLMTGHITEFPKPETLTALSRGLRIPVMEVIRAAAISVGIDAGAAGDDLVIPGGAKLRPKSREAVLAVAEELLTTQQQMTAVQEKYDLAAFKAAKSVGPYDDET